MRYLHTKEKMIHYFDFATYLAHKSKPIPLSQNKYLKNPKEPLQLLKKKLFDHDASPKISFNAYVPS